MNLTSKIIDNIQISIKNIHVRYEDPKSFAKPLSLGLTMERLEIETTNEMWERQFFDRTNPENKLKPLFKIIDLKNIGLYCNPKDTHER
jgi:vacuolar protein sorting-associated protein 13A/C